MLRFARALQDLLVTSAPHEPHYDFGAFRIRNELDVRVCGDAFAEHLDVTVVLPMREIRREDVDLYVPIQIQHRLGWVITDGLSGSRAGGLGP
jgi:hypothetical protein